MTNKVSSEDFIKAFGNGVKDNREITQISDNDLISRSALKKEIESLVVGGAKGLKEYYENGSKSDENSWIGGIYDAWELVVNAPTELFPLTVKINDNVTDEDKEVLKRLMKNYKPQVLNLETNRPQGEWIPVSERLPEESLNSVIGWDAYRERCVFVQYIDGHFQITGNDESFNIVAWQSLPEPYKKGSAE